MKAMNSSILCIIVPLVLLISSKRLLWSVSCERIPDPKMETKVDIEVAYAYSQSKDKPNYTSHKLIHKVMHVSYNVPNSPKGLTSEARSNTRQANNNNVRHGFRFSTIEKGAGAFTMSTYENEASDGGMRARNNIVVVGQLIHVVSVSGDAAGNSSALSFSHNACHETVNSVQGSWVALVQNGVCSPERKLSHIMKLTNQPASILIYGSSQVVIKQDSFLSLNQYDSPIVIFLPWNNIQDVVQKCFNSSGQISLPQNLLDKMNRTSSDWPFNSRDQCNVTIRVNTTSDDNFLNKTSVLFVSISFILLMVISLAWLMFYYVQRFRYIHTKEQFSRRLAHMAKKAVAKIPVKTLKQGDKETDADVDNCAICIECYKPSDTVRILPCKHYFHKSCIDPWLLEQRSCPMCKLNILHAYGFLPNERGSMISDDRLSELDSSLELQFMPGSTISPQYGPSTRIQALCQGRDSIDSTAVTSPVSVITSLPPIFTEPRSKSSHQWTSLRVKRTFQSSHHIDRSLSLRHLNYSVEERTTFLPHNRPLSQSASHTTLEPDLSLSLWRDISTFFSPAVKINDSKSELPMQ